MLATKACVTATLPIVGDGEGFIQEGPFLAKETVYGIALRIGLVDPKEINVVQPILSWDPVSNSIVCHKLIISNSKRVQHRVLFKRPKCPTR